MHLHAQPVPGGKSESAAQEVAFGVDPDGVERERQQGAIRSGHGAGEQGSGKDEFRRTDGSTCRPGSTRDTSAGALRGAFILNQARGERPAGGTSGDTTGLL